MLRRRKQVWIPLLLLVLTGQLGYIWSYRSNEHRIRKAAKLQLFKALPEQEMEVFVLEAAAINWEDEGKEFLYHGELYDVVKQEIRGSKLVLYCLNDHEENRQLRELTQQIWKTTDPASGKTSTAIFKVLPVSWFYDEPAAIAFPQFASLSLPLYGPEALVQADLHQNYPPPKA